MGAGESLLEKAVNVQVAIKESTIIVLRDRSERTQRKDPKVSLHSSYGSLVRQTILNR